MQPNSAARWKPLSPKAKNGSATDASSSRSSGSFASSRRSPTSGFPPPQRPAARAPFLACFFFLWGGIEVLEHHINAARTDLKAQIKQLQAQLLELQKTR
jgi:hypothetical protein